jgi:hypothetical protein
VRRRDAWWIVALALAAAALLGNLPTASQEYAPGRTYFGRRGYVEFRAGGLPIILSAPHGGTLEPAEIPDRAPGTTVSDLGTEDLARSVAAALRSRTGREPALVICRLKRVKLDVNREIGEGAQGNPAAYHRFLDAARTMAAGRHGRALVVDLHGHGHPRPRTEIGYLLSAADLDRPDAELDDPIWARQSSVRSLSAESGLRFSALIRGPSSLGGLLESAGYPSVPGPATPGPGADPYFEGGYITRRHGSAHGGPSSAIQIETPYHGLRDTPAARARFAEALADALAAYVGSQLRIAF